MNDGKMMSLEAYFSSYHKVLVGEVSAEAFAQEHGLATERVEIYPYFVRCHVEDVLEKIYTLVPKWIGKEVWQTLVDRFWKRTPFFHYEMNQCAQPFAEMVALDAETSGLSDDRFLADLCMFEWYEFEVYVTSTDIPRPAARPALNPTLHIVQSSFDLAEFVTESRRDKTKVHVPSQLDQAQTLFVFRHPQSEYATWRVANDGLLFAFKMVHDELSVDEAAEQSGLSVSAVQGLLKDAISYGVVIEAQ